MRFLFPIVLGGLSIWLAGCATLSPLAPVRAQFFEVAARVEPVAEAECQKERPEINCDFLIRLDPDRLAPANAYQGLDRNGRPVITFSRALLPRFRSADEMAFVMAHEAAHHIRGHLDLQHQNAVKGATILGEHVTRQGGSEEEIANAQYLGAIVGARSYSKAFELEADALGAVITRLAGYSPRRGLAFFEQVPDPGDRFLGTHPSNPDRVQVVEYTITALGLE